MDGYNVNEEYLCNNCGKNMRNPSNGNTVALCLSLNDDNENTTFLQKQMGKFELDKKYSFCYECFIQSFFKNNSDPTE